MTRTQVLTIARSMAAYDRQFIWTKVCHGRHEIERLARTDDGDRYCPSCCTVFDEHGSAANPPIPLGDTRVGFYHGGVPDETDEPDES